MRFCEEVYFVLSKLKIGERENDSAFKNFGMGASNSSVFSRF